VIDRTLDGLRTVCGLGEAETGFTAGHTG